MPTKPKPRKSRTDAEYQAWGFLALTACVLLAVAVLYHRLTHLGPGVLAGWTAAVVATLTAAALLAGLLMRTAPIRIKRSWPDLTVGLGLSQRHRTTALPAPVRYRYPRIVLTPTRRGWKVAVRMLPGQVPADYGKHLAAFAHAWRAHDVTITSPRRGWVVLQTYRRDPLRRPGKALTVPAHTDLAVLPLGRCQDGSPWRLRLSGTHVLLAGATGSGKGSIQWGTIRALLPGIRAGLVRVVALDPKRMELAFGKPLFHRYESDPTRMVELLEHTATGMQDRADRYAGKTRIFTPTPADPFVLVLIDEVAFLTAYMPDRKLRERALAAMATLCTQGRSCGYAVHAALQDPRKEVMSIRGLFPTCIALRLAEESQVDMVLGDGALEAGARCHEIDERTPGVGYVRLEGSRTVTRVRAAFVTDGDIDAMTADVVESAPVLSLVKPVRQVAS